KLGGVVARWSDDTFLLRLAYSRYQLDIEQPAAVTAAFNALINLPAAQCLNCAQILPVRYRTHDVNASLLTVGGSARLGDTLLQGEWQRRLSNSNFLNDVSAWYVHASHRVGQFTPYVSWGRSTVREPRLGLRPGPNASPAFASRLEFIDRLGLQGVGERRQLDLGLRWDFREAMALKAQWTRHDITQRDIGSGQAVTFPIPSSRFDGRVNVYSLNVDFVF
ncbi:hypothetical protein, partial [Chitinimonas sp.]|uniref:hypothetical protein n=1 Tax=Chitinimonas sp. TaxID=1934313 RepID=UPI0035AFAD32